MPSDFWRYNHPRPYWCLNFYADRSDVDGLKFQVVFLAIYSLVTCSPPESRLFDQSEIPWAPTAWHCPRFFRFVRKVDCEKCFNLKTSNYHIAVAHHTTANMPFVSSSMPWLLSLNGRSLRSFESEARLRVTTQCFDVVWLLKRADVEFQPTAKGIEVERLLQSLSGQIQEKTCRQDRLLCSQA